MATAKSQTLSKSAEERLGLHRIEQRYRTLRTAIRSLFGFGCVYMAAQAVGALAGQSTSVAVNLALQAFAEVRFALAVTLMGCAAAWAVAERMLRYRKVEVMATRLRELETAIDPNRTSSGLTPSGRTHPQDKRR